MLSIRSTRVIGIVWALLASPALAQDDNHDGVPDGAGTLLAKKFSPTFVLHFVANETEPLEPEPVEILVSGI